MQTLPTSKITPEHLSEIRNFAESDVSPGVRDLLLDLISSIHDGDEIIAAEKDESLTPSQAAKQLGMSRTHLYKLLDRGDIAFYFVGRDRRIRLRDLVEFEKKRHNDRLELAERFASQRETAIAADEEIARLL